LLGNINRVSNGDLSPRKNSTSITTENINEVSNRDLSLKEK
ncbi:1333_t:CDS:2, partial [Dentiscutata heterogama]